MTADTGTLDYSGVRVSQLAIAETSSGRVVVHVPGVDVLDITVRHGLAAERPVGVIACGLLLISVGAVFVRHLIMWFWQGGKAYVEEGFGAGLIVLGALLVRSALRRRYFVAVRTASDLRKLAFAPEARREEVLQFVTRAGQILGCPIRIELT